MNTEEIKRQLVEKYLEELGKKYGIWFEQQDKDDLEETLAGYLPSSALVRPLVWEEAKEPNAYYHYYAETPIGRIYISKKDDRWYAWLSGQFITPIQEDLAAARSVALTCYQSLIGSCLQGGGYTEEQVVGFAKWLLKLRPIDMVTVHPPAGSGGSTGIHPKSVNDLFQSYLSSLNPQ